MNNEVTISLSGKIKYHSGGQEVESNLVSLKPPSYKHMDKCIPLKQAFYRAAAEVQGEADSDTDYGEETSSGGADLDAETLIAMFYQSEEDMLKIMLYAVELLTSKGIAYAGGSEPLTKPILESMPQEDIELLLGEYMVNFILASVLRKAENKSD